MAIDHEYRPVGAHRRRLRAPSRWVGWLPVLALTLAWLLGVSVPVEYQYLPLLASVVLLGLPHGAVDYVALPRALAGRLTRDGLALVAAIYLVGGLAYGGLWFLAPVPAAVLFVALTWFHWGQGELYPLVALYGADYLDSTPLSILTILVRGGLPMVVPLVAFPDRYRAVLESFVAPFGATVAAWPFAPTTRLAIAVAFGGLTVLSLALSYRRATGGRAWRLDAAETALLWGYFLVVPPVLAVGVYFCLWHSVRHIARVIALDERAPTVSWRSLGRFAVEALPATAGALVLFGALWLLAPSPSATVEGVVGLYLVLVAVLTLPHTVVVSLLDREQGLGPIGRARF
jgi:Brp/Blh family beta-carotene 15,15'-monooxygenase